MTDYIVIDYNSLINIKSLSRRTNMKKTNTLTKLTVVTAAGLVASPLASINAKADTVEAPSQQGDVIIQTVATKEPTVQEVKEQVKVTEKATLNAKEAYESLEQKANQLQAELVTATDEVEQAEEIIASIETELPVVQNQLTDVTKELEEAQTAYTQEVTTNPTLASELEIAEKVQKEAEEAQANVETQLTEISKSIQVTATEIAQKEKEAQATQNDVTTAQVELEKANTFVSAGEINLAVAKEKQVETQTTISDKVKELEVAVVNGGQDTIVSIRNVQVASIDGSQQVESNKSSNHEQVIYAGNQTIEKELTPTQLKEYKEKGYFSYTPDANAITQYMVTLLKELRELNDIHIPVPEMSVAAMDYATKRVNEIQASRTLSHNTSLDTTDRNGENAGILNVALTSNSSTPILSDEQMAYYLLNLYFADYENLYSGYGHRIALLTASGDGLGNGFAGRYHVMNFMDYRKLTDSVEFSREYWDVLSNISYATDAENTMYLNGKRLNFLPRTTFTYITKITETIPNIEKEAAEKALNDYKASAQMLLLSAQNKVTEEEKSLASARASRLTAKNRLSALQDRLVALKSEVEVAKTNLQSAQTQEADLRSKLIVAMRDTVDKKTTFDLLSKKAIALVSAKDRMVKAEEMVASLNAQISSLTLKLGQAKLDRDNSQSTLQTVTTDLESLLPHRAFAKEHYNKLNSKLAILKSQLTTLEAKEILSAVPVSEPIYQNVVANTATQQSASALIVKDKNVSPITAKTLPSTGDKSTVLLTGLGLLLSVVGVAQLRRKED